MDKAKKKSVRIKYAPYELNAITLWLNDEAANGWRIKHFVYGFPFIAVFIYDNVKTKHTYGIITGTISNIDYVCRLPGIGIIVNNDVTYSEKMITDARSSIVKWTLKALLMMMFINAALVVACNNNITIATMYPYDERINPSLCAVSEHIRLVVIIFGGICVISILSIIVYYIIHRAKEGMVDNARVYTISCIIILLWSIIIIFSAIVLVSVSL